MSRPLAIYGSHDSSVCFITDEGKYMIYEFERILNKKHCHIGREETFKAWMLWLKEHLASKFNFNSYGSMYYAQLEQDKLKIMKEVFGFDHMEEMSHHACHAAGALYQSPFNECIVISSDSGGYETNEGISMFTVFHCDKSKPMNQVVNKVADIPIDICGAYTVLAIPISEIKKSDEWTDYLNYAGKLMGLAAYGKIREEWIKPMKNFFYGAINLETLAALGNEINLDFSKINTISGPTSYDIAATVQHLFEEVSMTQMLPYINNYRMPVILTGGGALNVLFNEKLRKKIDYSLFVPVNPNDSGLSYGMMCLRIPPEIDKSNAYQTYEMNIMYNGVGILDIDDLPSYVEKRKARLVSMDEIADLLYKDKIIGVIRDGSEVGPRALGNRSILCNAEIKGIKDLLNHKIKFREWFRPFAPVVVRKRVRDYFEIDDDSPFMSFAVTVVEDVADEIPGVVHEDGTARVQTVSAKDNPWLNDLLHSFGKLSGYPILLNTSFNIKGKPILTTIKDALQVLDETGLDYVLVNNWIFSKQQ